MYFTIGMAAYTLFGFHSFSDIWWAFIPKLSLWLNRLTVVLCVIAWRGFAFTNFEYLVCGERKVWMYVIHFTCCPWACRTLSDVVCCSVNITICPLFGISFCSINLLYVRSNHKSLHILQILTLPFWNVQKSKSCSMSNIDFNFNSVCIWGSY